MQDFIEVILLFSYIATTFVQFSQLENTLCTFSVDFTLSNVFEVKYLVFVTLIAPENVRIDGSDSSCIVQWVSICRKIVMK